MLYVLMWITIGIFIGLMISIVANYYDLKLAKQNGYYTQTYIRGDCRGTITFNPTETIITIQVDWNRYDSFDQHMGAISNLISIAYQGEDGTPLKYLKQIEQSQVDQFEQKDRIDQHIEKLKEKNEILKEKNEILIKERDEIQNTYRGLKQYLRDCYNGAKSWLDQPEERFHDEPPF